MTDNPEQKSVGKQPDFASQIGRKAERRLKAQRNQGKAIWFSLGMIGLIGWSVAIPALLGAALGLWLDKRYPGAHSWTLMFLVIGLVIGCINAWRWVDKEEKDIHREDENGHE